MKNEAEGQAETQHLEHALERLRREGWSLVVVTRDGKSHVSRERGVAPLVELIDRLGAGLAGAVLADKVVGRAAALMAALAGMARVHALVMSEPARRVLASHGIPAGWDRLVAGIQNRAGNGPCPMEALTMKIDEPAEALARIRKVLGQH